MRALRHQVHRRRLYTTTQQQKKKLGYDDVHSSIHDSSTTFQCSRLLLQRQQQRTNLNKSASLLSSHIHGTSKSGSIRLLSSIHVPPPPPPTHDITFLPTSTLLDEKDNDEEMAISEPGFIHYFTNENDLIKSNVQNVILKSSSSSSSSSAASVGVDDDEDVVTSLKSTIGTTLEELSNQQESILASLEDLKQNHFHNNNNNNNNGDDDDKDSSTSSSSSLKREKDYLFQLWNIANEMDIQLHDYYQTNSITASQQNQQQNQHQVEDTNNMNSTQQQSIHMKDFNNVIVAWKNVMHSYQNCIHDDNYYSLPVGIPQRATRLLDTMEKQQKKDEHYQNSRHQQQGTGFTIDTYNNVLEIWTCSREHNLDKSAEMIFRRLEHKKDDKYSMVDRFTNDDRRAIQNMKNGSGGGGANNDNTANDGGSGVIRPNVDTMRIMMRAWCKLQDNDERMICQSNNHTTTTTSTDTSDSTTPQTQLSIDTSITTSSTTMNNKNNNTRKGSSVFHASWYLIQMQALLESGRSEFEPSLDDYTKILKAWSEV